jgi:Tfp pilus assembly protein PilX
LKKSFSLLITLVFVIVVAIIGVMSLEFAAATNKHTAEVSMDSRAELMSRAATEYAIMAMQGHDYNNNCLKHISLNDTFFDVNITYHYFLTDCNTSSCNGYCSNINTADTNGSALIYVTVTSKNPSFYIRKVRFTLQNP